ncbi:MAG: amino acid permease [Candidatus Poseidoniaceae archaeon]|nr:amino acid permease [Candidatus Poseidoniaceae archaeon]
MDLKGTASKVLQGDVKGVVSDVSHQLERTIGLAGVIIISLSAMLGSGLFVLPSLAANMMGTGIWLAYILAAAVVLPGALSKSELASAMPTSGGSYVFIERTYGPLLGTIAGLGLWASFLLKAAFALIGLSAYTMVVSIYFDIDINSDVVALSVLGLVVLINILGVKKIKVIQAPIVGLSVLLLIGLTLKAMIFNDIDLTGPGKSAFETDVFTLAETAAFVFVAYAGVTKIAAIAEEIKDPGRNLPGGILISLAAATILYSGVAYIIMSTLDGEWWNVDGQTVENPIYIFAETLGGSLLGLIAAILAILTMASMALAGILAASRYIFAMARDNLLPQALENVNAKWETPHWPIIITGIAMALAIIFLPVSDVAKLASGFQIMIFIVVNSCVIVLRKTANENPDYNPTYHSPMYPIMQLWGIIGGIIFVVIMGEKAVIGAVAAIILGLISYYIYGKKHAHPRMTPFKKFRMEFSGPTAAEHERRSVAFHAADMGGKNHLTLQEFQNAMHALGFNYDDRACRVIFHQADSDENGIIEIDEFLDYFEHGENEE